MMILYIGSFYPITNGMINEDGTTTAAMNGLTKDVFLGGKNKIEQVLHQHTIQHMLQHTSTYGTTQTAMMSLIS